MKYARKYRGRKRMWRKKKSSGMLKKLSAKVRMLQRTVKKEEKKRIHTYSATPNALGQVAGNLNGGWKLDITPDPSQGDGYYDRSGSAITAVSSQLRFQISNQSACNQPSRFKIQVFRIMGTPWTSPTFYNTIFDTNLSSGIVDYNSSFNPDYRPVYKLLRTKTVYMPASQYAGQTRVKEVSLNIKYGKTGHNIRFNGNTTDVLDGQIICLIRCDNGNNSALTASTLNVPISAINTGYYVNHYMTHYFKDN